MKIEFLYFDDCPSHEDALQRLRDVMASEGISVQVAIIQVETDAEAQQHQFPGSPTIRINGRDIAPTDPNAGHYLACRVYQWADGRFSAMPSPQMIRKALLDAKQEV